MRLEYIPQIRNTITFVIADKEIKDKLYRLSITTGTTEIADTDWQAVKDDPDIKALLESGDLKATPTADPTPESAQETKAPAKLKA